MLPTLSQVCTLHSTFADDIEQYAAGTCHSVEIWLTKLEQHLANHSLESVLLLLEQHQVQAPVASFQGGLLDSQGARRHEAWELFRRRLTICRSLNIQTLVVACDVAHLPEATHLDRIKFSLNEAAETAAREQIRIALEFQARAAFGNNLQSAAAIVEEIGHSHLGICFDAYHYYVGPSKPEDLASLLPENTFVVQLCDLANVAREFAQDSDRILPGEGDIPLRPLLDRLRQIDYTGCISLELLNPRIWQIAPRQFSETAMTALRQLLEKAK